MVTVRALRSLHFIGINDFIIPLIVISAIFNYKESKQDGMTQVATGGVV